ncbi:nucleoside triphosphate pyrophosphohydrolase family protein [Heyndrickxia faecalis]|uniref:nucleoside triphosphate pyrophosphohydrolase family protein n=1 Tax=Heyndrickxia TaxID=2837504 RepID=UPI003100C508
MQLNEFQIASKRTMPSIYNDQAKANYALGLCGEAGEVVDLIKKEVFHGHQEEPEKVKNELGDLMHYVAGVATIYGWTLEEVCAANIKKLLIRYPNGFNSSDSIRRVDEEK